MVRIGSDTDAYLDAAVVQSGVIEVIRFFPLASKSNALGHPGPGRAIFRSGDSAPGVRTM